MSRRICLSLIALTLLFSFSAVAEAATVKAKSIKLSKSKTTMSANAKLTLEVKFTPKTTTDKKITWSSSNKKVAKVDKKGNVTALKKGTATITAKTKNGKKATCKVTVKVVAVKKVALSPKKATITSEDTKQLTVKYTPASPSNTSVTWYTSKPSVATVDKNGLVTARKAGTATIKVKSKDGGKIAECQITVKEAPVVDDQPMLDEYCKQVVTLVNQERAKYGLNPLTINTDLMNASNVRAKELLSLFDHTRPNGTGWYTAVPSTSRVYATNENIAAGWSTPAQVMSNWMSSSGHRANILGEESTEIGVGIYKTTAGYGWYWVQLFGYIP